MSKILEDLRAEHASMARLLDALDRQVVVFRDGGSPDYEIIEGVTKYFCDFPDLCHHPKEDILVQSLLEQAVDEAQALKGLSAQHEELAGLTGRFAKVVRRVLDEAELPREIFLRAAQEFVESQRYHMQMEEKHFFPFVEAMLREQELQLLDRDVFKRRDPLFDPAVLERYARLRDDILAWQLATEENRAITDV